MKLNLRAFNMAMANAQLDMNGLARQSKVSLSTISKAANNKSNIRPVTIGRIAKALGVDPSKISEIETH